MPRIHGPGRKSRGRGRESIMMKTQKEIHKSWEAFGLTDTGKIRSHNQDCFFIAPQKKLYIVADGMGGHNAGEIASFQAVKVLADFFLSGEDRGSLKNLDSPASKLIAGFLEAHQKVIEMARKNDRYAGMGCTMTAVLVTGTTLHFCHVGDARVYFLNKDGLHRLTLDHSLVMELVRSGQMTIANARRSPIRNRLSQAVGAPSIIKPEYGCSPLNPGDKVLLCTDGLWDMLQDNEILDVLKEDGSPETLCRQLIEKALDRGGRDNVTVIVINFIKSDMYTKPILDRKHKWKPSQ